MNTLQCPTRLEQMFASHSCLRTELKSVWWNFLVFSCDLFLDLTQMAVAFAFSQRNLEAGEG